MQEKVIQLVKKDKLKEAIELKMKHSFNFIERMYYLNQVGRLSRIEIDKNAGILPYEKYTEERNKIRVSILNEPYYIRIFSSRIIASIFLFFVTLFFAWTILGEPKLLNSKINNENLTIIVQHESLLFANTWFNLANSDWFFLDEEAVYQNR